MTDQLTFDSRLQDAFERYLEAAPVSVDVAAVAAAAVAPVEVHARVARTFRTPRTMRYLLIAAALLAALAVVAASAGGLFRTHPAVVPTLGPSPAASLGPDPTLAAGAPAWDAIYLRQDLADTSAINVVAVRPDGQERFIRSIPTAVPGAKAAIGTGGLVSRTGWLHLYEVQPGAGGTGESVLIDLNHPSAAPRVIVWGAPLGPRWSTTGLLAIPGYGPGNHSPYELWSQVTVLDPRTGATTPLGSIGLFGGGPSIVWASDSSGIWDNNQIHPIDGGPDVDIRADLGFTDRRVGLGGNTVDLCDPAINGVCTGAKGPTVRVLDIANHVTTWYDEAPATIRPTAAEFASDGRRLLVLFDRTEPAGGHTAVVGLLTAPGRAPDELASYALPPGAFGTAFVDVSPDDSAFSLAYWTGDPGNPTSHVGPVLHVDGAPFTQALGTLAGYVPGPLVESWPGIADHLDPPVSTP